MAKLVSFCIYLLLLSGPLAHAQENPENQHAIYVSSISWHTGIVVPGYSLPDSLWREGHLYEDIPYLEFGWGDTDYFTYDGFDLWYAIKAAFWPTSSALHLNPIHQQVEEYYFDTDVVRIELNDEQLRRLSLYLIEELELDENGKIIPVAKGVYPDSHFYKGNSSYYFPKNSNVWAARAIQRAGFSISPIWHQTTGCLLNKVEDFGKPVVEKD